MLAAPGPNRPDDERRLAPFEHAVNSAEARVRLVWFTLTSLTAYVFVAFLSTSHEDMLLQSRQKLPLLQIELPLDGFALIGPVLLLLVHIMTLVNVLYVKDALGDYCGALAATSSSKARSASWSRIASGIFIRGPGLPVPAVLRGAQWLLEAITVWLAPPITLLFCQLRFLPYHNMSITWAHRTVLLLDVLCIAIAAIASARYLAKRQTTSRGQHALRSAVRFAPGAIVLAGVCFLSLFVFQHRQDEAWNPLPRCGPTPCVVKAMFERVVWPNIDARSAILYRDLHAPASRAVMEPADKLTDLPYSISFRLRDLEGAELQGGRFYKADFSGANLRGVSLRDADLREAQFGCFRDPIAYQCANLQFADLSDAQMQGADFGSAEAQGVSFSSWESHGAQLQRANFFLAKLTGAHFYGDMSGANFNLARLVGAQIFGDITGADFTNADLSYANLSSQYLAGVNVSDALLQGTDFSKSHPWRVVGAPRLAEEGEPMTADCHDVKPAALSRKEYLSLLSKMEKIPVTLDRPVADFSYMDPGNDRPGANTTATISDSPDWLTPCRNYDPAKQDADLARQYVQQICTGELADDIDSIAAWPRHDYTGRFHSTSFDPPPRRQLLEAFYRQVFSLPECTHILAIIRKPSQLTGYRDLFHEIWRGAEAAGVATSTIAAAIGPCDDCTSNASVKPAGSK